MSAKTCTLCLEAKPATAENFSKDNSRSDGLSSRCKPCKAKDAREYRLSYPDRVKASEQKRHQRDKEKRNALSLKWREENSELAKQKTAAWRAEHPNYNRDYQRQYREDFPERAKETTRKSRLKHIGRVRLQARKGYAMRKNARGVLTAKDLRLIRKNQDNKCWYCSGDLLEMGEHVEHRIPLSRGGTNYPSNIVLSCPKCNMSKGGRMPHEWSGRLL